MTDKDTEVFFGQCDQRLENSSSEKDSRLPTFVAGASKASPATGARLGASSAGALATADEALRLAELVSTMQKEHGISYSGRAHTRMGSEAARFLSAHCRLWPPPWNGSTKNEPQDPDRPSIYGHSDALWHTLVLCFALGRGEEASHGN